MDAKQLSALVKSAQAGQDDALGQLYEACHEDIYRYILKTAKDQELAMDLTQDTFEEILQTIQKLDAPEAFVAWSRQVAYHKCTAYFRKRRELLADEDEDGYSVFDTLREEREEFIPDQAIEKDELRRTILGMVDQLPEEQRTAVLLRYYNEGSIQSIAQTQGVSENTVKSRLNYGRRAIRQAVEAYEKKSGVRLHCAGAVPLLLWVFGEAARAQGLSVTTKAVATFGAAAGTAATGAATGTVATGAAKAAGSALTKKLVAGAVAVAVAGGVTAGVLLGGGDEPPLHWRGHSELNITSIFDVHSSWFDLELSTFTDTTMEGSMAIRRENLPLYDFSFTGTAQDDGDPATEDPIRYTLQLDEPITVNNILTTEHTEVEVLYTKSTDSFYFEELLNLYSGVTLHRAGSQERQVLLENVVWEGDGKDTNHLLGKSCHLRLEVAQMSNQDLTGTLIASDASGEYFRTAVTADCIYHNGMYWYHLYFETPREESPHYGMDYNAFWMLLYHPEENTLATLDSFNTETFRVTMTLTE